MFSLEVSEHLHKLGLTKYQSNVLSAVISNQNSTAEEISRKADVPITKVYSVLESLENMNIIKSTLERPKKFVAINPDHVVDFLIKRHETTFNMIKEYGEKTLEVIRQTSY